MKLKVGDKVLVCNSLRTTIESISEINSRKVYWFMDKTGKLYYETESAIKIISDGR